MASAVKLRGEAAEVSLAEAQAVGAMIQDEERRGRFASLVAAIGDGEVADEDAEALGELLELGLQTGRLRALRLRGLRLVRHFHLLHHEARTLSASARAFRELLDTASAAGPRARASKMPRRPAPG